MPTKAKPKVQPQAPLPEGVEVFLTRREICRALKIQERKFYAMVAAGEFPKEDRRFGNRSRWKVSTYTRWMEQGDARSAPTE